MTEMKRDLENFLSFSTNEHLGLFSSAVTFKAFCVNDEVEGGGESSAKCRSICEAQKMVFLFPNRL